ncbi:MAG: type II toxin-antitoxin system ChpB family toxin [Acidobacteriota bacterium]
MERGDVFHVDLNPIQGREQSGARYVLIVSTKAFNVLGTPLVCPVTQGGNFARHAGFAVSLSGAGTITQGVVLCNQPRALDLQARKARFIEKVPDFIIDEVLSKLATLID